MALDLTSFVSLRPYLYHLTAASNLESILLDGKLRCANEHLALANLGHLSPQRRKSHLLVSNPKMVALRDQQPLIGGNIAFEDGWTLERFVAHVNDHVFFWPGTVSGPILQGWNHFKRYQREQLAIFRIPTADLEIFKASFCPYNSGAPRCSGGKKSPRGSETYMSASRFQRTPSEVVEVVFRRHCALPPTLEISNSPAGPWRTVSKSVNSI